MKKLNEHEPRPESWSKIIEQGDFDSQLCRHLNQLPEYSPQAQAWDRILSDIEKERAILPWLKWTIAASVAALLLMGWIASYQMSTRQEINESPSLLAQAPDPTAQAEPKVEELDLYPWQDPEARPTEQPLKETRATPKPVEPIQRPQLTKPSLPETALPSKENLGLKIPAGYRQDSAPAKTLHQVSISWSKTRPGMKVTTPFGRKETDLNPLTQASIATPHLTLEINN